MTSLNRTDSPTPPRNLRSPALRHRPKFVVGRLGVISGYFQLSGIGAALQTLPLAVATFFPRVLPSPSPRPIVPLIGCAILAFGFFRTSHLLDQRRRSGAQLAALCFLASLAGLFTNATGWMTRVGIGVSVLGLVLVASVWKHLEND